MDETINEVPGTEETMTNEAVADAPTAEAPTAEAPATSEAPAAEVAPSHTDGMHWYIVQAFSNYERKVRLALLERIQREGLESQFGEILVPKEEGVEVRDGKKRKRTRLHYPGYIFVQMHLSDETWHLVKSTPRVSGFIGGRKPSPVPKREIAVITSQQEPAPRVSFVAGDHVRVTQGAFANYTGTVEEVQADKAKVRVLISIFGRATPVELEYSEVEKTG